MVGMIIWNEKHVSSLLILLLPAVPALGLLVLGSAHIGLSLVLT